MIPVSIIGGGGLTGRELLGLLQFHPGFEVVHITSNQVKGKSLSEAYPSTRYRKNLTFQSHSDPIPKDSLVVLATPNEVSLEFAPKLLDSGHKVIDLSGSFRLHDLNQFQKSYQLEHSSPNLMNSVVFGIPELYRSELQGADFVSNPGCFPTTAIYPLRVLQDLKLDIQAISMDSKSGVSGAGGRTEEIGFSFTNTYENFRAYKILKHQHEPEVQEYGILKKDTPFVFTPHLLPVYRGILSTIVIFLASPPPANLKEMVAEKIANEPFVRFLSKPEDVELTKVQNTNFLDFSLEVRGNQLVLVSAIDNLVKGAAGQALQNMNLMCGHLETMGF